MPPNDIHHMELTRAAPICIRFVESAFQVPVQVLEGRRDELTVEELRLPQR